MSNDNWVEVNPPPCENGWEEVKSKPKIIKKKCEAVNCLEFFEATWPTMRRCQRCRREKREYKTEDSPF